MNLRIIQMLVINLMLIISILFFGNDARSIVILFLLEILIVGIFRSVRVIRESHKRTDGHLSERTQSIVNMIAMTAGVFVFILIFGSQNQTDFQPIKDIMIKNVWILAAMIVLEAFFLIKYLINDEKNKHTYAYGYVKILVAFILMTLISPIASLIRALFDKDAFGFAMVAMVCIIAKVMVDYSIIRREEKKMSISII